MIRVLLLVALVLVAVVLAFMTLPGDPARQETVAPVPATPVEDAAEGEAEEALQSAAERERDARLAAMKERYAVLERERRNLAQRLNKIRYYLAAADLPAAQAEELQTELDRANRMLINPPLLGAFRGVEGIEQELDRIARINERLDDIAVIVGAPPDYQTREPPARG